MTTRYHMGLRFQAIERGLWWCEAPINNAATMDFAWELERRRSEPGNPAGWYVYGPGAYNGTRAGPNMLDAMRLVYELLISQRNM